ncbi:unnamed protein product [Prunus brigantina]
MIEDGLAQRRPEAPRYTKPIHFVLRGRPHLLHRTHRAIHGPVRRGRFGRPQAPAVRPFPDRRGFLLVHKPAAEFGKGLDIQRTFLPDQPRNNGRRTGKDEPGDRRIASELSSETCTT